MWSLNETASKVVQGKATKSGRFVDTDKRNPYSPDRNWMTEPTANSSRRGARTFRAACLVLASVAVAQAAATAWSSKTIEAAGAAPQVTAPNRTPADPFLTAVGEADPYPEMRVPAGDPPPNDPALALLRPQPVVSMPKPAAPLDVPITDEEVLINLDEALHLRSQGDMQGALVRLRTALQKLPDHPRLLYQTARTLDTMGLLPKAEPYWKSLRKLGKGAGDFYTLAQDRIADGPQMTNEEEEEKESKFTITDLRDEKVPDPIHGERVRFTAVLKKNSAEPLPLARLAEDMVLAIHFFDSINGQRIARSQVPQPELQCLSEPLDWSEGPETFSFEYLQPDITPEQMLKYGRSKYFGCALEVIYMNKLQDSAATAPILLQMARELPLPAPEPVDAILDSTPGSGPGGQPESGLFPPMLKP